MSVNITQLHRLVIRKRTSADAAWTTLVVDSDDLGQDAYMTVNIAPRMRERASARGTTSTPVPGTFDAFAGTINLLLDNFKILGELIGNWKQATYEGADANAGQVSDAGSDICAANGYWSVIAQGICDDGSSTDIELTRCQPSVTDDIEPGTTETATISIALNPIIYNASLHSEDGYPEYSYRFGDYSTTEKMRLNVTTGEYEAVITSTSDPATGNGE